MFDTLSGDLEYIYSSLMKEELLFDDEKLEHRDILYTDQIEWAPAFDDMKTICSIVVEFQPSVLKIVP